jgi:hypothetical protein
MRHHILSFCSVLILFSACAQKQAKNSSLFTASQSAHTLNYSKIDEASGLDAGIVNKGKFWTHNDSAGDPEVYLIDSLGQHVGTVVLEGLVNRDWEDITVGPGPEKGKSYVYIAEIGDNNAIHSIKYIYRFVEPLLLQDQKISISAVDTIAFQFDDGQRDSEALMIDDATSDLYIFSKREKQISLYTLPFPQRTDTLLTASKQLTMPLTQIVAADFNAATGEVLLKNYNSVYYWKRKEAESIVDLLRTEAQTLPYEPEPQGESICFDSYGQGYYTVSEAAKGIKPALLFYKRNK